MSELPISPTMAGSYEFLTLLPSSWVAPSLDSDSRSGGPDFGVDQTEKSPVFLARSPQIPGELEVRFVPWLDGPDAQQRLNQHYQQAWKVLGPRVRTLVEFRTDSSPATIIMSPREESLTDYFQRVSPDLQLRVVREIGETVEQAILGGLCHGLLCAQSVQVKDDKPQIDYLQRFYSAATFEQLITAETDILAVTELMASLLSSVVQDKSLELLLTGKQRGQLRSLVHAELTPHVAWEIFDRWMDLLRSIGSRKDPISGSDDPLNASLDHAGPSSNVCDVTGEVAVELPDVLRSDTDLTSEVEISLSQSSTLSFRMPRIGQTIGDYQLESLLGEGGMGVVYRAVHSPSNERVALKILRPNGGDVGQAVRRFRKEARLLAMVDNPHIARLYHSGTDQGYHFIAMEFVEGPDLKSWLARQGALTEADALSLVLDISKALSEAHQLEIVHRDLKPENILLEQRKGTGENHSIGNYVVKLTDFGIARTMSQSGSLEMTKAGTLLGTPTFMAPEQFKGSETISPAADVYSLGITLFLLLSGNLPFQSDDPMKLAALHCFESQPDVRRFNPAVSDATVGLLNRMLAKRPADRPADASQLVREIERLQLGETVDFDHHTGKIRQHSNRIWKKKFQWELESSPEALWPLVSNTERLNRASGLQSVQYRTQKDPEKGLRRFGSFRLGMMRIEWEEHPFEWIEGRRMGILREFQGGPFVWFLSLVELSRNAAGKTVLTHSVEIEPRNALGRMVAQIEAGWKGGKALDRVYRRIDQSLQLESQNPLFDPFEAPERLSHSSEKRIEQRLEELLHMGADLQVAERFVEFLRTAAPQTLGQIRPIPLAERLGLPIVKMVDVCLLAVHCRLLNLRWDVLCPTCKTSASSAELLSDISKHTNCEACDVEFRSDLASAIELVFQVHPEIRGFDVGHYCIGGPEHSPHVVAQVRLEPEERLELEIPLSAGEYLLRQTSLAGFQSLQVRTTAAPSQIAFNLSNLSDAGRTPVVRSGMLSLSLLNDTDQIRVVRLERRLDRQQVLTAAMASALPKFRELFPSQVLGRQQAIATEEMTLIETRISSCEKIYSQMDEADAYLLIQTAIQHVENTVQSYRGAVIKAFDDRLVASFQDSVDAVRCVLELPKIILPLESPIELELGVAVHRGPLLVTTQNGRLDYFGTTVRQTHALCEKMERTIGISESVAVDTAVFEVIQQVSGSQVQAVELPDGQQKWITIIQASGPIQLAPSDSGSPS